MSSKKPNDGGNQPPSLFDNLDLFAQAPAAPAAEAKSAPGEKKPDAGKPAAPEKKAPPPPPAAPGATPPVPPAGSKLTGHGPLRELYDYNFR